MKIASIVVMIIIVLYCSLYVIIGPTEEWEPLRPLVGPDGRHAVRLVRYTFQSPVLTYTFYFIDVTSHYASGPWHSALCVPDSDDATISWSGSKRIDVKICKNCRNTLASDNVDGIDIVVIAPDGARLPKYSTDAE